MSDRVTIVAEPRSITGKKVKQLRQNGLVPGVIYGQGDTVNVQMDRISLRRALRIVGTTQLAEVDVDGQPYIVLVREIQQHLTRGDVLHVDFMQVDMKSTITAEAEVVKVGAVTTELAGMGSAVLVMRSIPIECLPDALISEVEVDVSGIESVDDLIFVSDLPVPKGVTFLAEPDDVVARFETLAAEIEEEEEVVDEMLEPAADAVEVIGRGKKEDEEFED